MVRVMIKLPDGELIDENVSGVLEDGDLFNDSANGTKDQISYYGKPVGSFRFSTHWNWRESLDKCTNERYIQCLNMDLPFAKKRKGEGQRSDPVMAEQIAYYGPDLKYHTVYGEMIDKKQHKWTWLENSPEAVSFVTQCQIDSYSV